MMITMMKIIDEDDDDDDDVVDVVEMVITMIRNWVVIIISNTSLIVRLRMQCLLWSPALN